MLMECTQTWNSSSVITLFTRMIVSLSPFPHLYPPFFRSIARFGMGKGDLEKAVPAEEHEVRPISSFRSENLEPELKECFSLLATQKGSNDEEEEEVEKSTKPARTTASLIQVDVKHWRGIRTMYIAHA